MKIDLLNAAERRVDPGFHLTANVDLVRKEVRVAIQAHLHASSGGQERSENCCKDEACDSAKKQSALLLALQLIAF